MENNHTNSIAPESAKTQSDVDMIDLNQANNIDIFKEQKKEFRCKQLRKNLNSIPFQIVITVFTVVILFSDQVRNLTLTVKDDFAFDIFELSMMGIFLVQLVLSSIAIENYLFSFFFWLDFLSTISIVMDVNMITDLLYSSSTSTQTSSFAKIAGQSKASRAATRAVRIVKLIRLLRLVKLYKSAVQAKQIKANLIKQRLKQIKKKVSSQKISHQNVPIIGNEVDIVAQSVEVFNHNKNPDHPISPVETEVSKGVQVDILLDSQIIAQMESKQSNLSKMLSYQTIKKVIIILLLIMLIVPLFDPYIYTNTTSSMDFFLQNVNRLLLNSKANINDILGLTKSVITDHITQKSFVVYFSTPFNQFPVYLNPVFSDLRFQQTSASTTTINVTAIMSLRPQLSLNISNIQNLNQIIVISSTKNTSDQTAYFQIGRILFICLVLGLLLNSFANDTNTFIVEPIEYMIQKVKNMALNPTLAVNDLIQQTQYETAVVHNAIMKIGSLLSIVFGNAGAQIIGTNMMRQGDMNPLTKGKKKCAIYGFCDIRDFTDATQVLQQDIMVFVNTIGQIVHSAVYRYGGSANKNIGDAFLLVWKIPQNKYKINKATNQITWTTDRYVSILADFALLSFIKVIVKINKQPKILKYMKDQRLLQRLGPNYQVKMGFGLHIGWAIQGAIGSQYKIDASYLSPNVNMASRLEAATKQYGVPLLISSAVYEKLTVEMKQFCRNIDRVTVKGSNQPIGLYTVDLDLKNISPPADKSKKYSTPDEAPDVALKKQINMEYLSELIDEYDAYTFIENKKQLRQVLMINLKLQDFKCQFESGFQNYINGTWSDAINHFNNALKIREDAPTRRLLQYINQNIKNGIAPTTWKKYRQLTEK